MHTDHDYLAETLYSAALEAVAMGETYEATRGALIDSYPAAETDDVNLAMSNALRDARRSGVEREDIDESWF